MIKVVRFADSILVFVDGATAAAVARTPPMKRGGMRPMRNLIVGSRGGSETRRQKAGDKNGANYCFAFDLLVGNGKGNWAGNG